MIEWLNVIVSGLMHPSSVPARVLSLVYEARPHPVIDLLSRGVWHGEFVARPRLKIPADRSSDFLFPEAVLAPVRVLTPRQLIMLDEGSS